MDQRLLTYAGVFAAGLAVAYVAQHSVRAERAALSEELAGARARLSEARADLRKARAHRPEGEPEHQLAMLDLAPEAQAAGAAAPPDAAARVGAGARLAPAASPAAATTPVADRPDQTETLTEAQRIDEVRNHLEDYVNETSGTSLRARLRLGRRLLERLRELGEGPAATALVESLYESTSSRERSTAASLLGALGDVSAVSILQDIIATDRDVLVRRGAMRGLRLMGSDSTIPMLEQAARDPREDRFVRFQAAYGLAQLDQPSGVQSLASLLMDANQDGSGRYIVFRALKHLDDPAALPAMRQLLTGPVVADISYRVGALEFLGRHGDPNDVALVQQVLNQARARAQPAVIEAAEAAYQALGGG